MPKNTLVNGPDFMCIGMPKAGTGWLYDQLSHHPDFWMPPIKELHYLGRSIPKLQNAQRRLERWNTIQHRRGRTWGERERGFLADAASCAGEPRNVGRYASLFRHKGDLLSGDTSPGYCTLGDDVVGEIAAKLPETKVILLVREPISRTWSQICNAERSGRFDVSLLDDPARFAEFIRTTDYVDPKYFPTRIIRRWSLHYPADTQFRVILFDDLAQRPAETLREILKFLGADHSKVGTLPADHNRKARAGKIPLADPVRNILVEYLSEEVRACSELLGGAARAWPALTG